MVINGSVLTKKLDLHVTPGKEIKADSNNNATKDTKNKIISEQELRDQLGDLRNSQLKRTTKLKSLISSNKAVDEVLKYDKTIDEVSTRLEMPKEMIQSVLYREIICYDLDDVAIDIVVPQYYMSKNIPIPGTAYDLYNSFNLDGRARDSSTGIGQIFAKTAIDAERDVNKNYDWDRKNEDDLWKMWQKLQDPETNIDYIGQVLEMEAKRLEIKLSSATRKEKIKVMGEYNGNIDYGRHAIKYYDLFKKYNK